MLYNGIELEELTSEKWDGRSREMLVWSDYDAKPTLALVCGFTLKGHPIADIGNYKKENAHKNYVVFQYCAEIPNEELNETIENLKTQIERLKEENKNLKNEVNELKNSCSYQVYSDMWKEKEKYENKIANLDAENEKLKAKIKARDEYHKMADAESRSIKDGLIVKLSW